jgi:hypothetical protein
MKYKILCLLLLVGFSFHAQAGPVLSFDPSDQQVGVGVTTTVDLRISGLGGDIVTSFDLSIFFDDTILIFNGFTFGTDCGGFSCLDVLGLGSIQDATNWGGGEVTVLELSLDFDQDLTDFQPNDFVLGTFTFTGLNPGVSGLDIFIWELTGEYVFDPDLGFFFPSNLDADVQSGSIEVLTGVPDFDGDGVPDDQDNCPATVVPESLPTRSLGVNRFALVDGDNVFDTKSPKGKGPRKSYTISDTAGCSCTQIVEAQGLGKGHTKFGCSISAMDDWVLLVNP